MDTYLALDTIHSKYGAGMFGRIAQKLLAITLRKSGFDRVVDRQVQGVDIDLAGVGTKYSVEVKTTKDDVTPIEDKDVTGLREKEADGYLICLAVLKLSLLSQWIVGHARNILPGQLRVQSLALDPVEELQGPLRKNFDGVVADHQQQILSTLAPLAYLDRVLKSLGVEVKDT